MDNLHDSFGSAEREAYEYIRQRVLSGELPASSPVNQEEIAARLRLSRIPVRDAIRRLHAEGLVSIRSNRRTVVTQLTRDEVIEIFEIRAALEGVAAAHAVRNLTPTDLLELELMVQAMDQLSDRTERWLEKHDELHDFIAQRAGRPRLRAELRRLRDLVSPYIRIYWTSRGNPELAASTHGSLIAVLRERDPEAAERALRGHVGEAITEIAASIEQMVGQGSAQTPQDK